MDRIVFCARQSGPSLSVHLIRNIEFCLLFFVSITRITTFIYLFLVPFLLFKSYSLFCLSRCQVCAVWLVNALLQVCKERLSFRFFLPPIKQFCYGRFDSDWPSAANDFDWSRAAAQSEFVICSRTPIGRSTFGNLPNSARLFLAFYFFAAKGNTATALCSHAKPSKKQQQTLLTLHVCAIGHSAADLGRQRRTCEMDVAKKTLAPEIDRRNQV